MELNTILGNTKIEIFKEYISKEFLQEIKEEKEEEKLKKRLEEQLKIKGKEVIQERLNKVKRILEIHEYKQEHLLKRIKMLLRVIEVSKTKNSLKIKKNYNK